MDSGTIQTALHMIYPPMCLTCSAMVDSDFGLCGTCWRETKFIGGAICDACGTPLMGADVAGAFHCDDCIKIERPWQRGRSALLYKDNGRRVVLGLKHGDRQDVVGPASKWMAAVARDIISPNMLLIPIPLHWSRLLKRRYNQAALLAQGVAGQLDLAWCPDGLQRLKRTQSLDGMGRDERFAHLEGVIRAHPRRRRRMIGRSVLLVDDVMTSGATLAAATIACLEGGAANVNILTLARVAKDA
ncbi:MAG: ComF family protein [Candidatus Azotimanducaceae bacterium]|jgi:ComF family protein